MSPTVNGVRMPLTTDLQLQEIKVLLEQLLEPKPVPRSSSKGFWQWMFDAPTDAELARENQLLKAAIEVKDLEIEMLGQVNEHLRCWLLSSTAAAVHMGAMFGAPTPTAGRKPG